jgi:hypothetical protein
MRTNIYAGRDSPWKPSNADKLSSCTPQQSSSNSKAWMNSLGLLEPSYLSIGLGLNLSD